ncbi:MAG: hypothetical protein HYR96_06475 [Deltaproteobacteria bacterium]|nr:hypothetical protein [Deltaproteobacteria bacterium]MBI3295870.1 hypothetical protein [Deltaproteobacteria bacterium]
MMSKRLQVLIPDDVFKQLQAICRDRGVPVADFVRTSIESSLSKQKPIPAGDRIARILKFAKFDGPTGDIDKILREIDKGKRE